MIATNYMSSKDTEEKRVIHLKIYNKVIISGNNTNKILMIFFASLFSRNKIGVFKKNN